MKHCKYKCLNLTIKHMSLSGDGFEIYRCFLVKYKQTNIDLGL